MTRPVRVFRHRAADGRKVGVPLRDEPLGLFRINQSAGHDDGERCALVDPLPNRLVRTEAPLEGTVYRYVQDVDTGLVQPVENADAAPDEQVFPDARLDAPTGLDQEAGAARQRPPVDIGPLVAPPRQE